MLQPWKVCENTNTSFSHKSLWNLTSLHFC